jgi:ABC-2 type transport system permease protein
MALVDEPETGDGPVPRRHAQEPELRVVSAKVSLRRRLREIWLYRELLVGLTRKELKVKYKNSILGFLWSMLNPASVLLVYYVVFQLILKNGVPYFAIYLIAGILVWNVFSVGLLGACTSVVGNASIVKKVFFPREILALASVGAALVHFFLQTLVLVIFLAAFQRGPAIAYLPLLIPALMALLLLTAGMGIFLAGINVRLRDTQHLLEVALQVWFWATPIVYQYRLVRDKVISHPHGLKHVAFILWRLNPVTPIVLTFQRAIYGATSPKGVHILPDHAGPWWYLWQDLLVLGFAVLFTTFALKHFSRVEGNFAEDL